MRSLIIVQRHRHHRIVRAEETSSSLNIPLFRLLIDILSLQLKDLLQTKSRPFSPLPSYPKTFALLNDAQKIVHIIWLKSNLTPSSINS
jgi:hypothetical protein